ncbi:MAG: 30S ribosomal protein S11 [candidate division WS6 bacterium GW2011_GWA2_37_6]|uniref:Small ribosomal subunit protein uS11 n=1 Tax=candidate division WS6 bacterium GW2011_GWA2_37_6 TaxID=1619087 RepID=A0A0G0GY51_9BACT|nr:MAG: 30S ribosomal protein S11 [candidate division WS6 bacterium GW2011_GWA2_37_6]
MAENKVLKTKKKAKKQVQKVIVKIKSGYNNTIVSIVDYEGNTLAQSSGGAVGFKGSRKSTAFAATKAAEDAVSKASKYGIHEAVVVVKGMGMGRQAAVKGIRSAGLKITSLSDHTPVPHGGVTSRKQPKK